MLNKNTLCEEVWRGGCGTGGFLFFKLNLAVMERKKKAWETQILLKAKRTRFCVLKSAIIDQDKSVS